MSLLFRSVARSSRTCLSFQCRQYATPSSSPAPPLLLKLRTDLKTAMKAKDAPRLAVLRNLLAEVTNAAKTNQPISSDLQLLSLLRKRAAASKAASLEFKQAGREDLVEGEEKQVKVMEEYAGGVETVGEDEVRSTVESVIGQMQEGGGRVVMGEVLKKLFAPGGGFEGKPVEKGVVAQIVKQVLAKP